MRLPARTAREYPTIDSHLAPDEIRCRSVILCVALRLGAFA
jgi:hypothetical protein